MPFFIHSHHSHTHTLTYLFPFGLILANEYRRSVVSSFSFIERLVCAPHFLLFFFFRMRSLMPDSIYFWVMGVVLAMKYEKWAISFVHLGVVNSCLSSTLIHACSLIRLLSHSLSMFGTKKCRHLFMYFFFAASSCDLVDGAVYI